LLGRPNAVRRQVIANGFLLYVPAGLQAGQVRAPPWVIATRL
jgi:hypothetical protein